MGDKLATLRKRLLPREARFAFNVLCIDLIAGSPNGTAKRFRRTTFGIQNGSVFKIWTLPIEIPKKKFISCVRIENVALRNVTYVTQRVSARVLSLDMVLWVGMDF